MAVDATSITELQLIIYTSYALLLATPLIVVLLVNSASPYGRYTDAAEKRRRAASEEEKDTRVFASSVAIPARVAWVLMEIPSLLVASYAFYAAPGANERSRAAPVNNALVAAFLAHYAQRSLVYPCLIRGGKPTPVSTFAMALGYCALNGYLQGRYLALCEPYPAAYFHSWNFVAGMGLFACGMGVNLHSDHVLRSLRKPGDMGYSIPLGGMFRLLSAPNLFGELCEWSGFALACWSWPALSFAALTAANLVPRGVQHHRWYLRRFGNAYPAGRRAVIPFLL